MIESDEQIMGLVPPSNYNGVETEVDSGNETAKQKDDLDEFDIVSQTSDSSIDEIIEL
jgi:hypothetical protein